MLSSCFSHGRSTYAIKMNESWLLSDLENKRGFIANAMCPAWVGKELALYCYLVMQAHYPLNFYLIGLLKVQQSYHYTIYDIRPPQASIKGRESWGLLHQLLNALGLKMTHFTSAQSPSFSISPMICLTARGAWKWRGTLSYLVSSECLCRSRFMCLANSVSGPLVCSKA